MNWSGSTSKPIRSAEWRSPTKRISTPRSVHPCANYKTTPRKSAPSTKSQLSNTPHESEPTYGLINTPFNLRPVVVVLSRAAVATVGGVMIHGHSPRGAHDL